MEFRLRSQAELIAEVRAYYATLEARVRKAMAEGDELVSFAYSLGEWDYRVKKRGEPNGDGPAPQVVVDALLAELAGKAPSPKGITALRERIGERLGVSESKVRRLLQTAYDEGLFNMPQVLAQKKQSGRRRAWSKRMREREAGAPNGARNSHKPRKTGGKSM